MVEELVKRKTNNNHTHNIVNIKVVGIIYTLQDNMVGWKIYSCTNVLALLLLVSIALQVTNGIVVSGGKPLMKTKAKVGFFKGYTFEVFILDKFELAKSLKKTVVLI